MLGLDVARGVVLKKDVGGQKEEVGGRTGHVIVVKIQPGIYRGIYPLYI